jgi:hypothetical protein
MDPDALHVFLERAQEPGDPTIALICHGTGTFTRDMDKNCETGTLKLQATGETG